MTIETNIDDDYLTTGTHQGSDGATDLYDPDAIFPIEGVIAGLAIYKDVTYVGFGLTDGDGNYITDGDGNILTGGSFVGDENGAVTSFTDTGISSSGITSWNNGDTYSVYKTATKDSFISRIGIDKSRGWKYTNKSELTARGWRPKDVDIDKDTDGNLLPRRETPFGKGGPKKSKRVR